jgi:BMFP domain-containing protein YqiC
MDNRRILDDLTRVAGGAFTVLSTLGKQVQNNLKDQMGNQFSSSESNDAILHLQGMVTKLRIEQEDLKKRIRELETLVQGASGGLKTIQQPETGCNIKGFGS